VLINLRQGNRPLGQLFVGSGQPRSWDEAEIEGLQLLASVGAQALEGARRMAEERQHHRRINAILERLPLVVAVIDSSGQLLHMNAAARVFSERMGTAGKPWREGLASIAVYDRQGSFVPVEERGTMRAFAGHTTERDLTLVGPSGVRLHIRAISSPLWSADGSVEAVATSFQDVTELREMADAKDRFLSIASHELRSPITSLRATTSLLQIDPSAVTDADRRRVLLGRIQRQIDRLSTLVERLLDTTRLGAGELPLDYADGDLVALCRDAVELVRLTDREHPYTLDLLTPDPIIDGRWDLGRIEQVLANLLSNANRYSPAGREIRVQLRVDGDRVLVDVIDQGSGMAAAELDKLFTPFYRGASAARHKGGLGLGLYITGEIVRRHGGTMRVRSTPGQGSTFTVELPRKPIVGS
jgi:signal transduction histidine kinase